MRGKGGLGRAHPDRMRGGGARACGGLGGQTNKHDQIPIMIVLLFFFFIITLEPRVK